MKNSRAFLAGALAPAVSETNADRGASGAALGIFLGTSFRGSGGLGLRVPH
jgi:hypothetical protein